MNSHFSKIFPLLFRKNAIEIIETVKKLPPEIRKNIFLEEKQTFKTLKSICKYSDSSYISVKTKWGFNYKPKIKDIKSVAKILEKNLDNLPEYIKKENLNISSANNIYKFYLNLQIFQVLISDKRSIRPALKISDHYPYNTSDHPKNSYIYNIGKALLQREESWKKDFIIEMLENCTKWYGFDQSGLFDFLKEIIKAHPEWETDLHNYIGKAVYLDGLTKSNWSNLNSNYILAGLEFDSENLNQDYYNYYLYQPEKIIRLIKKGFFEREKLITLTFSKLQSLNKTSLVRFWENIFETIHLNNEEKNIYINSIIDLLNALNQKSIQIGLKYLKEMVNEKIINTESLKEIVNILIFTINNEFKKIAKSSLSLLKIIIKQEKSLINTFETGILNGLYSNNKNIRIDIVKYFSKTYKKKSINENYQESLIEYYKSEFISSEEKELLENIIKVDNDSKKTEEITTEKIILNNKNHVELKYIKNQEAIFKTISEYQSNNNILKYESIKQDFSIYKTFEKIKYFDNGIDLINYIINLKSKTINNIDFEIVFNSIINIKNEAINEIISKLVKPLFEKLDHYQKTSKEIEYVDERPDYLFIIMALYAWVNKGKEYIYKKESIANHNNCFRWVDKPIKQKYKQFIKILNTPNKSEFLCKPVYKIGFIDIEMFLVNLESQNNIFNYDDYIQAVLRLPNDCKILNSFWEKMTLNIEKLPEEIKHSLIIIFELEENINSSIDFFIKFLSKNKPNDLIVKKKSFNSVAPSDNHDTKINYYFRIFLISLRNRYSYELDLINKFPSINNINLKNLKIKIADFETPKIDFEKILETELDSSFFESILNTQLKEQNKKINKLDKKLSTFLTETIFGKNNYKVSLDEFIKSENYYSTDLNYVFPYIHLVPYILGKKYYQPYYGFNYDENISIYEFLVKYPNLGQTIFEVGVNKADSELKKNDFTISLIYIAKYETIEIKDKLPLLLKILTNKHNNNREKIIIILNNCLKEGRITIFDFIESLVDLLCNTSKGLKYLLESLDVLIESEKAFEYTILLTLEKLISKNISQINNKVLSSSLTLINDILDKNKIFLEDEKAIINLNKISEAKKTSVSKKKATQILKLKDKYKNPYPITILALNELKNSLS